MAERSWLTRVLEGLCVLLMAALVLDVLWGVLSRYVVPMPSRWTDELAQALLIWAAMLGASLAHRERMHLGIVWLTERLDPSLARLVGRGVHVLVGLFASWVMIWGGWQLVSERLDAGQVLPALGWPKAYVYLAVPVAGVFIAIYSLRELASPTPPQAQLDAETKAAAGGVD